MRSNSEQGQESMQEIHEILGGRWGRELATLRTGEAFVMTAQPPECYAGRVGAEAVVVGISTTAIYVRFARGALESFPPARFQQYFQTTRGEAAGPWWE
jgi:hypothetical protein